MTADTTGLIDSLSWPGALFPYQRSGVERLVREAHVLLADEMGLGKTIQAIAALRVLHLQGRLGQALVVAPAGLVLQWRRQLRLWAPELVLSTVVGSRAERAAAWRAAARVFLVSYESLRADIDGHASEGPAQRDWAVAVIDEAQKIKTATGGLSRAVKRLRCERRWALTGTPLENKIDDLLSILDFVVPGRFDPRGMMAGLQRLLSEVQLRRRRRDVLKDLPPKLSSRVPIRLGGRQADCYCKARDQGLVRLAALGREVKIRHVLELILRLKQICNFCPESGQSAKLDDLRRRLALVVAGGEKALVFSQFTEEPFGAKRLARELARHAPVLYTGDMDQHVRQSGIAEFEQDGRRRLLVLSLRAGGIGLNLTSASHVFHFDRWWNPAVEAQAEDRAHRIGQRRCVNVYAYLCADTIEERIEEVLADKRALFADLVDGVDAAALRRLDLDTLLSVVRGA